jgi:hypothetical protein
VKKALLVAACVALSGCGLMQMQKFNEWNADARARAESGELAWSEYYLQAFNEVSKLPGSMPGKGLAMLQSATLLDAAKAMEAGQMPRDEFFSLQRKAKAQMQIQLQQEQAQAAAQQQVFMQQWLQTQALIQQQYRPPPTTNCSSYRVGNTIQTNCR